MSISKRMQLEEMDRISREEYTKTATLKLLNMSGIPSRNQRGRGRNEKNWWRKS